MKLVNSVAVPTTKLEKLALKNLKYDCIEKKYSYAIIYATCG